ncbi:MAG: MFS transporter [Chloroflexi bacterium]|nr:MFS transporter [Chloroflexota bacterium]
MTQHRSGFLRGRLFGGITSDALMHRFGRKPVLYFCIIGVTSCTFLALAVDSRLMVALFACLLGFSYGSGVGMFPTYLGDLYGVMSMPVLLGIVGLESATMGALGPWLFGTIYDHRGSYDLGFVIASVSCLMSLICLFLIKIPNKRKAIPSPSLQQ